MIKYNIKTYQRCRDIRTRATRYIFAKSHEPFTKVVYAQGAYSITSFVALFETEDLREQHVLEFIREFDRYKNNYKNLKELHIKAPFAALSGEMLNDIMNLQISFIDMSIEAWTFHSPEKEQWSSQKTLRELNITLNDGYYYTNQFENILMNLTKYHPNVTLRLENKTPHLHKINKNLLPHNHRLVGELTTYGFSFM